MEMECRRRRRRRTLKRAKGSGPKRSLIWGYWERIWRRLLAWGSSVYDQKKSVAITPSPSSLSSPLPPISLFFSTTPPLLAVLLFLFCVVYLSTVVFQKKPTKNANVRMSCVREERRILGLGTALTLCYVCLDLIGGHPRFYSDASSRARRYHSLWDILFRLKS